MTDHEELLPDPLPDDPLPVAADWYRAATTERVQPNPDAMVLATADGAGRPSARVVLCKRFVADPGYLVFFTNYASRKAAELDGRCDAAAVFHWDTLSRQIRVEGQVERSPPAESDSYFASRAWRSRISAAASRQSHPVDSRASLLSRVGELARRHGATFSDGRLAAVGSDEPQIPRPANWGGFRLWIGRVELWVAGAARIHDRGCWTRSLEHDSDAGYVPGRWQKTRLEP